MVRVLHDERPIARKQHQCEACGRTIEKGEGYRRQDCVFDGSRYTWKACAHCDVVGIFLWGRVRERWGWQDEGIDIGTELSEESGASLTDARLWVYFRRDWRTGAGELITLDRLREIIPSVSGSGTTPEGGENT